MVIACTLDSIELCYWKGKHIQRNCDGSGWQYVAQEKEPDCIPVSFDIEQTYEIFSLLNDYWGDFNACPDCITMEQVAKKWEQNYGMELVGLSHDTLTFQSNRQLSEKEAARIIEEAAGLQAEIINCRKQEQINTISETGTVTLWWD